MEEVDWVDLPDDDFVAVLGYETPNTIELSKKIKIYNSLKKSERENLSPGRVLVQPSCNPRISAHDPSFF